MKINDLCLAKMDLVLVLATLLEKCFSIILYSYLLLTVGFKQPAQLHMQLNLELL